MTGTSEDADAETLCVIVGKIHSGGFTVPEIGSCSPATWSCGCSGYDCSEVSLGSRKMSSGAAPVLCTVILYVTALPRASETEGESGSAPRLTDRALNRTCPVNGSDSSLPGTGEGQSMISVHTPAIGLDVYSDSCRVGDSTGTPLLLNPVVR